MSPKATLPRKKSCNSCFKSKLRCDLRRPSCTRCEKRSLDCVYASGARLSGGDRQFEEISVLSDVPFPTPKDTQVDFQTEAPASFSPSIERDSDHARGARLDQPVETLNFSNVQLLCTVDAHRIRVRWLESLLPSIDQRPKPFQPTTMAFAASIFKSYPSMFVDGGHPPFIHGSQVKRGPPTQSLENCANIARMWAARTAGSVAMVRNVITQEMRTISVKGGTVRCWVMAMTNGDSVHPVTICSYYRHFKLTFSTLLCSSSARHL